MDVNWNSFQIESMSQLPEEETSPDCLSENCLLDMSHITTVRGAPNLVVIELLTIKLCWDCV